jgi:Ca2+-binding RTX toxin-like protein
VQPAAAGLLGNLFKNGVVTTFNQTPILGDNNSGTTREIIGRGKATYASDFILARGSADEVFGYYGDDLIRGGEGNDTLYGGFNGTPDSVPFTYETDGQDILEGELGNDSLIGGTGNDILNGGGFTYDATGQKTGVLVNDGTDTLVGGLGNDIFVFNTRQTGIDRISDFQIVVDNIQIEKASFGATANSQFNYNSSNGALLFNGSQFATLTTRPTGFDINRDIVLV